MHVVFVSGENTGLIKIYVKNNITEQISDPLSSVYPTEFEYS